MKDPVDHVLRPSLPWRDASAITECGYDASKVKTLTREEFFQRVKDLGERRTAMTICMTCSDTAKRWCTWDVDPRLAMHREIAWERGESYWGNGRTDRGQLLRDELIAIAAIISAHRDEFDATILENEQRREWLAKKAALSKLPKLRDL